MTLVNKLSKSFRWLRWSTMCAILFYVFFIGLILHSASYKLQHTLRTPGHDEHENRLERRISLSSSSSSSSSSFSTMPEELERQKQHQQHQQQQQQQQQQQNGALIENIRTKGASDNINSINKSNTLPHSGSSSKTNGKLSPQANVVVGTGIGMGKSAEPETVILAASSVNEKQILAKAFRRADKNHDDKLTIQELAFYINHKIVEHIDEAIMNNAREFRRVDISPADGLITWDEYHRFFLREHGMTEADIDEHDEIKHTSLNRKAREDMMRDKARWAEAARTDLFTLTIDEYLAFRHPESSVSNLLELVDDLLRQFDQDGDDQLTIEEFSELNIDDDDDLMRKSLISKTLVERRAEFKRILDKNHDGKADRGELLNYVNPKTPRYALQESATLFSLCDDNKDGNLTLDELVANAEIFLTSKLIDTANSFHSEF